MLDIVVDVEGALHRIETSALVDEDLEEPLARFGGYLRAKSLKKFEQQDFTPLSAATLKKRAAGALRTMGAKLERDLGKANKRADAMARRTPRGLLGAILGSVSVPIIATQTKGQTNRKAVLDEFRKTYIKRRSKAESGAGGFQRATGATKLTAKAQLSLAKRVSKAVQKAMDAPILGKLPKSEHIVVEGNKMMVVERTKGTWSDVHNKGGAGGHGAREPKRETMAPITKEDLDVLRGLLKEAWLIKWEATEGGK